MKFFFFFGKWRRNDLKGEVFMFLCFLFILVQVAGLSYRIRAII